MSVTDPYFVRIDAEVARLARASAEQRKMPLRELTERALRMYISEETEPERRAAALHAMEEALLGRLDRRLGQHMERVAGLYAREAFDLAQMLDLVKRILVHAVRDREMLQTYLSESRAGATRVLKQRAALPVCDPGLAEDIKKAQEEAARWKAAAQKAGDESVKLNLENVRLQNAMSQMERDRQTQYHAVLRLEQQNERLQARFVWATQQFEGQRGFSKRPIGDFLAQWDRENGGV